MRKGIEKKKIVCFANNGNNKLDNTVTSDAKSDCQFRIHTAQTGRGTGIDQHTDRLGF